MELLSIRGLRVELPGMARPILDGVDLDVGRGEVVALVGESGSGKSVTARAALGLTPPGVEVRGSVSVAGTEVLSARPAELREIRTRTASMIFQDPRASINPVHRIGDFLTEPLRRTLGWSSTKAKARAVELLGEVGLTSPERRLRQYPHEFSGGMLQRIMIAGALAGSPDLLLCDEPTTALDVSTQAEIMTLLARLRTDHGLGILLITHDLELAASTADRISVMYAGRIVETGDARRIFDAPLHPYTGGLLASTPRLDGPLTRLTPVPGAPLSLLENPPGCPFAPRCPRAAAICTTTAPQPRPVPVDLVSCHLVEAP
ncbi:ABC transporter ATP-binding protein [Actinocorallia lasiicapitis]